MSVYLMGDAKNGRLTLVNHSYFVWWLFYDPAKENEDEMTFCNIFSIWVIRLNQYKDGSILIDMIQQWRSLVLCILV